VGVEFKNKEVRQRIAFLALHAQYGYANRFQANCEGSIHGFSKLQSVTLRGETIVWKVIFVNNCKTII
jgi:hypothetical protein